MMTENSIELAYFEVNQHGRLLSGNRPFPNVLFVFFLNQFSLREIMNFSVEYKISCGVLFINIFE